MKESAILSRLGALKKAGRELRAVEANRKNQVLCYAAQALLDGESRILKANQKDLASLKNFTKSPMNPAFVDRLLLNSQRIKKMAESLIQVSQLPDPVGEQVESRRLENGLELCRVRSPLGVILMIFESRPNVAIEAFSLAFKAGNVIILKGGKESTRTTQVFYQILQEACLSQGLSKHSFWGLSDPDRTHTRFLLSQKKWIDVVVPRGGEKLIEFVSRYSEIPMIKNDRGLCHIYVDEHADESMAAKIVINAKTQRPGVCNAMETLLVHRNIAARFLPMLYSRMASIPVEWKVCQKTRKILKGLKTSPAHEESWNTEYLGLVMNCKVVESVEAAIVHIESYGSKHSEAIVTQSESVAKKFQSEIDAAVVYWNASTRFTDGFEFGLGGELGISTQKLHVRGPVGLRELTSVRWIVQGDGQTRV